MEVAPRSAGDRRWRIHVWCLLRPLPGSRVLAQVPSLRRALPRSTQVTPPRRKAPDHRKSRRLSTRCDRYIGSSAATTSLPRREQVSDVSGRGHKVSPALSGRRPAAIRSAAFVMCPAVRGKYAAKFTARTRPRLPRSSGVPEVRRSASGPLAHGRLTRPGRPPRRRRPGRPAPRESPSSLALSWGFLLSSVRRSVPRGRRSGRPPRRWRWAPRQCSGRGPWCEDGPALYGHIFGRLAAHTALDHLNFKENDPSRSWETSSSLKFR
jgi:hypothetical protein